MSENTEFVVKFGKCPDCGEEFDIMNVELGEMATHRCACAIREPLYSAGGGRVWNKVTIE